MNLIECRDTEGGSGVGFPWLLRDLVRLEVLAVDRA